MSAELILVIVIIAVALSFDFVNGFHDAANSVATVVATRVLTPLQAVVWAAFFNFVSAFSFGTGVAKTVGSGMVDLRAVTVYVIVCGLVGPSPGTCSPGGSACPPARRTPCSAATPAPRWRERFLRGVGPQPGGTGLERLGQNALFHGAGAADRPGGCLRLHDRGLLAVPEFEP